MALLHAATLEPSKQDLLAAWLPEQPWAGGVRPDEVTLVGAHRFDDPEGEVGLETHLVRCGEVVLQVPLTYRSAPLAGADAHLVGTTEHSALGTRWVYDGCADASYVRMLAAVTLTGTGQAATVFLTDGRARTRSPSVRLSGDGWLPESGLDTVDVDGWGPPTDVDGWTVVRSAERVLSLARRPDPDDAGAPVAGTARLLGRGGGLPGRVVLATLTDRSDLSGGSR